MKAYQYNLIDELIVDNFAGGGGASTGIELATGRIVDIAINHDKSAIEMHEKNHPYTKHFCEDVWQIDPRKVTQGRPVALVWCSPDCKHFSKAKGGTPVSKKIRGLAWVALRWAATVRPRVIILENVEEFMTWGPIKDGRPIKEKQGRTFQSFVRQLRGHGYAVDWKVMKACDYGAPTSRKRFFLIARCDGQPIIFPAPTHGKGLKPYRTAAECIDWNIPCKSIFGRKKPLKENTLKRIARGLDKFVLKNAKPFIMSNNTGNAPHSIDEPVPTVTTGIRNFVITPYLSIRNGDGKDGRGKTVKDPIPTLTGTNHTNVITPFLSKYFSGEKQAGASVEEPMPTVTAIDHNALCMPFLTQYHGLKGEKDTRGQKLGKPLATVDTAGRYGVVAPYITTLRNHMDGQSVKEPLTTITAKEHHAVTKVYLEKVTNRKELYRWKGVRELLNTYAGYTIGEDEILIIEVDGEQRFISDIAMRMLEPKELAAAQGFPSDYILQVSDSYTKSAQIARIGNSVCPVMAKVLVRANLPELCGKDIKTMAQLEKTLVG